MFPLPLSRVRDILSLTAVHLHSLQAYYDRSSSTVVVDQRPLINFTRCAKILQRIDDIRRYHPAPSPSPSPPSPQTPPPPPPPPGPLLGRARTKDKTKTKTKDKDKRRTGSTAAVPIPPPGALAWVKKELDKAPRVISREQFEARVSALAEIERQMRKRRELELGSFGFETRAPPRHRASSSYSPSSPSSLGGGRMASLDSRLWKI